MIKKATTITQRLIKNRYAVWKEVTLIRDNFLALPFLGLPLSNEPGIRSELNPRNYHSIRDFLQVIGHAVWPSQRISFSHGSLVCYPNHPTEDSKTSKWFFINGIAASPPVAVLNGKELARAFHRPIHLIHNPTYSAAWDIVHSFTARTLRKDGYLSRPAYQVIKQALLEQEKVILIGHSQGTIVNSYVVRNILKDPHMRNYAHKLEVYCIAGVADSFQIDAALTKKFKRPVPYVEHFANEGDFFARIGVLAHLDRTEGPLFTLNRKGHLLNNHYIGGILRGDYCNGSSRLYKYTKGGTPDESDYLAPHEAQTSSLQE